MIQLHPRVEKALVNSGANYKIHRHVDYQDAITNADDFSQALGYEIGRITKTLFVRAHDGREFAALVCSMDRRIDFKAAARVLCLKRIETASQAELEAKINYPRNGVSPVGLPRDIRVLIDEGLGQYPTVLIGGGETAIEIEIAPKELARICECEIVPITKP